MENGCDDGYRVLARVRCRMLRGRFRLLLNRPLSCARAKAFNCIRHSGGGGDVGHYALFVSGVFSRGSQDGWGCDS